MSARTHIAYVCADRGVRFGAHKGASAHVAELTRALANRGAEVCVIAARAAEAGDGHPSAGTLVDLGANRLGRWIRQAVFSGAGTPRANVRASEAFGLLLNQAVDRELERLHRRWRIDAVYERYSLWSYAAAGFARAARVPYLLEVNAPLRDEQRRYRALENAAAAAAIESYLFRVADGVIVPSAELRPYVVRRGARPGRVRVMVNAADPARFRPRSARRRGAADEFVVGFVGSLKPWHGLEYLVRAFRWLARRSAAYRLLIVGDGPLRGDVERMLRREGLARRARLTGAVPHTQIPGLLAQMDVGVAPYPPLAGFYFSPLKVFEYMAAGVPVVASRIGQLDAVLRHRRTALLHRPGAVRELVACIDALRQQPDLAARLAGAARRDVCRRFTWSRNADRVLAMIALARRRQAGMVRPGASRGRR